MYRLNEQTNFGGSKKAKGLIDRHTHYNLTKRKNSSKENIKDGFKLNRFGY